MNIRIAAGIAIGTLALSGPSVYALCGAGRCVGGAIAIKSIRCEEGSPDCDRYCVLTDSARIVCAP